MRNLNLFNPALAKEYLIYSHCCVNVSGFDASSATLRPDTAVQGSQSRGLPASTSRSGLPSWARPNTGFTPRPDSRQGV